ncbi:DedA family protein [Streptacidiphilus sp. EB129]|uniref:DedA family protein n=1 Tax=Streptacidiphilus sp. EB129 TaxID=3156262 RepID=UPI00351232C5
MSANAALFGSSWLLIIALLAVLADAFMPLIPDGSLVIAATLDTSRSAPSPVLMAFAVALASFSGDLLLLRAARRGAGWAQRRLDRRPGAASAATHILELLETKPARTMLPLRFVTGGRSVLDLTIGTTTRPLRRFIQWSAVSSAVWACYIVGLGYLNAHTFNTSWLSFGVSCLTATVVSALIARWVQRERRTIRAARTATETDEAEEAVLPAA